MMKHVTRYGHFFVLLAFLVGVIAPACGFSWSGKYSVIEICTSQGMESRIVSKEGQPKAPHVEKQCQFCFAQANLKSFLPVSMILERNLVIFERIKRRQYQAVLIFHLSRDHAARAPPLFA